jgi:hypothetical protein
MKVLRGTILTCVFLLLSSFQTGSSAKYPLVATNFMPKETFEFRVHYGFITAGHAKVELFEQLYLVNGKVCFKATCTGRSSGTFDLGLRIRDSWSTYFDTINKVSQKSSRHIEEGNYRLTEVVQFQYGNKKAIVDWEKKKGNKGHKEYDVNVDDLQDIISGVYYLRAIDFSKLKVGDIINMNAFVEDKLYALRIRYKGKEEIDTDFGEINAIKLAPIMPENGLFEGENSIRLYLSDDANKLPLKIEADMFVGAVEVDLKKYSNLKYPINFSK